MGFDVTNSTGHLRLARMPAVFLALTCLGPLALTSCHHASGAVRGITVQEHISPHPPRVGPETVTVEISDATQRPTANALIMVEANMSHPGMSPVFGKAGEIEPGRYRAPINFNMGGDWIVLLHIKLPDGRKIERQMDVRGVRSN